MVHSKNSKILPRISQPARNPFFNITLKVLIGIALIQVAAALIILAPRFITTIVGRLPHKAPSTLEKPLLPIADPQKKATPFPLSRDKEEIHHEVLLEPAAADGKQGVNSTQQRSIYGNTRAANTAATQLDTLAVGSSKNPNLQPGASLSIIDIRHTHGSLGEQMLKIAIKSQTQEPISISDVKVQVYFYDQQGDEVIASKAPVTSHWVRSPVEWKDSEPEILEVTYQPDTVTADLYYVGYVVAVYYKGELQSYRADPVKLTNQFPIKVFIGQNEL